MSTAIPMLPKSFKALVIAYSFSVVAYSQGTEYTIRVIDAATNKPVKNANVVVTGTNRGTVTNFLGFCRIALAANESKVTISHVSYQTGLVDVLPGATSFNVALQRSKHRISSLQLSEYPNKLNVDFRNMVEKTIEAGNKPTIDSIRVVESYAYFPYMEGSEYAFKNFFGNAFKLPERGGKAVKPGKITLEFTIDPDGGYASAGCPGDSLNEICDALKRTLTSLPKWMPARQYNEPVQQTFLMDVYYAYPTRTSED